MMRQINYNPSYEGYKLEDNDNETTCTVATAASYSSFADSSSEFTTETSDGLGKLIFESLRHMNEEEEEENMGGGEENSALPPIEVQVSSSVEPDSDYDCSLQTKDCAGDFWNIDLEDVVFRSLSLTEYYSDDDNCIKKQNKRGSLKDQDMSLAPASIHVRTDGSNAPKKSCTSGKSVRFDTVQVRIYERILDVNPECSSGPSLGIGWKYEPQNAMQLDFWEAYREGCRGRCSQLVMSKAKRERLAMKLGHSQTEIVDNARCVRAAKQQRLRTINNLHMQRMEEAVERSRRKISKIFTTATKVRGSF